MELGWLHKSGDHVEISASGMARWIGTDRKAIERAFRALELAGLVEKMGARVRLIGVAGELSPSAGPVDNSGKVGHFAPSPKNGVGHFAPSGGTFCTRKWDILHHQYKERIKKGAGVPERARVTENSAASSLDERRNVAADLGLPVRCLRCGAFHKAGAACDEGQEVGR